MIEMERLSDRAIEIINELHTERLNYQSEYLPLIDAANRLSDYEDTGLKPGEIKSLLAEYRVNLKVLENCRELQTSVESLCELIKTDKNERYTIDSHWNDTGERDKDGNGVFTCANCGHNDIHSPTRHVPYCWYCGIKMSAKKECGNDKHN